MLNRLSDLVRLRTFAATVQPVTRVSLEALRDLVPGDEVRAQVEAVLADKTVRVAIRNQSFTLRLPVPARAGDTLQLSVVTTEPQIKFALARDADIPEPAASLSETARFITALLDESEKPPLTTTVRAGAPLLAGVPGDSRETAAALHDAFAYSGMFYEAHQAQWVAGARELAALEHEPQARFTPLRSLHAAAPPDGADDTDSLAVVVPDAAPHLPELPVHRDALTLIKEQLNTLETGQVAWHGIIWQDQPLDWEVAEEPPGDTPQSPGALPWRTRLRLTLPRLGAIEAIMHVGPHGVAIDLHADTSATVSALADGRGKLQQSLRATGITPLGISIHGDESA
jgi:hypothetical protein